MKDEMTMNYQKTQITKTNPRNGFSLFSHRENGRFVNGPLGGFLFALLMLFNLCGCSITRNYDNVTFNRNIATRGRSHFSNCLIKGRIELNGDGMIITNSIFQEKVSLLGSYSIISDSVFNQPYKCLDIGLNEIQCPYYLRKNFDGKK